MRCITCFRFYLVEWSTSNIYCTKIAVPSRVSSHMFLQAASFFEWLGTFWTTDGLQFLVNFHMPCQWFCFFKWFGTLWTRVYLTKTGFIIFPENLSFKFTILHRKARKYTILFLGMYAQFLLLFLLSPNFVLEKMKEKNMTLATQLIDS